MDDLVLTAEVADVILRAEVRGNRLPQLPGQEPQFSLFVTAGRVSLYLPRAEGEGRFSGWTAPISP